MPFYLYEKNNRLSFEGDSKIAQIVKQVEGSYSIVPFVPCIVDSSQVEKEERIQHCAKVSFLGKYHSKEGGHILVCVYSREYLANRGLDMLINVGGKKSVFNPTRLSLYSARGSMHNRIIYKKWNFEEREHMK